MKGLRRALLIASVAMIAGCEPAPETTLTGNAERGAMLFRQQCEACHAVRPGLIREGPSLHGVVGATAGTMPGFYRYVGLRNADLAWTPETLDRWLADPRGFLGGRATSKTARVSDADDRADIIAFLATLR
ncbi:MAG: cytochrome c family protein [Rhodospirillales bacterium]|nr:MAG: cytochrome c family protein [Rhodospirillales bacterium]